VPGAPEAADPELPVTYSAVLSSYTEGEYRPGGSEIGSGKGMSPTEAMLSAVGEAIERYSAARYRPSDLHRSSLKALQEDALDPRKLCLYEDTQYADPNFPFAPFDPDLPIDWVKGWWLDNWKAVWLPALPTYFNYHADHQEHFCQVTSNGLAAGADLKDAALRALFELVERDAFMLTWLCQRPGRRLLLDETLDVSAREAVRQLQECGVRVELYLLEAGISIPTVACLGLGDGKQWPGVTVALAAHASPHTAARKAILEQGHVGPYIRRLMMKGEPPVPSKPEDVRSLVEHALFYVPVERVRALDFMAALGQAVSLGDLPEPKMVSLEACVEQVSAAGLRVAVADVTSPDVATGPFRVARALGTHMQPIDFGFKLRRLANPRLKAMLTVPLNPYPHPLA
jgi:ribosomal protein S12 methylthiotransferase accessory factor